MTRNMVASRIEFFTLCCLQSCDQSKRMTDSTAAPRDRILLFPDKVQG